MYNRSLSLIDYPSLLSELTCPRTESVDDVFPYVGSTRRTLAQPASSSSSKPSTLIREHLLGSTNNNNMGSILEFPITKYSPPRRAAKVQLLSRHHASRNPQVSEAIMSRREYASGSSTAIPRQLVSPRRTRHHMPTTSLLALGDVRPNKRNRVDQGSPSNVLKVDQVIVTSTPALVKGQVLRKRATVCGGNAVVRVLPDETPTMGSGINGEGKLLDFHAFSTIDNSNPAVPTTPLSRL